MSFHLARPAERSAKVTQNPGSTDTDEDATIASGPIAQGTFPTLPSSAELRYDCVALLLPNRDLDCTAGVGEEAKPGQGLKQGFGFHVWGLCVDWVICCGL